MGTSTEHRDIKTIGQPRVGNKCKMCGKEKGWHNSYNDCFIPIEKRMKDWGKVDYADKIHHWYRGTKFV